MVTNIKMLKNRICYKNSIMRTEMLKIIDLLEK